jgi:glycerophosphoryl diester phosphodiesterase
MTALARPLLLGHRGARSTRTIPENTLASFDLCLDHGCDGFEFDVRATGDGSLVVCHDAAFRGVPLVTMSAHELAAWQGQGFLPALEDVLLRFSNKCFLDIELKVSGLEPGVFELLRRYPVARGCVVTSFLPQVLVRMRELDSQLELGLLFDEALRSSGADSAEVLARSVPVQWVLPEWHLLDKSLVSVLQSAGKRVGTWTVNGIPDMQRLAALGVEILISDETERLVNTFPVG